MSSKKKRFQRRVARLLLLVFMIMIVQTVPLESRADSPTEEKLIDNPNYKPDLDLPESKTTETAAPTSYTSYEDLTVANVLKDIDKKMGLKGTSAVTEVFSINNRIDGCYYKPAMEDIYSLEEYVMSQGFASAYTGYFDLDASAEYTSGQESRALEILGYDFLLSDEHYEDGYYRPEVVTGNISNRTAIMNIYKALGIEIQDIQLFHSAVEKDVLLNSPVIKNLPWLVNDLDASRGRTDVFVSRTVPTAYAAKAQTDLHFSDNDVSPNITMTSGEFIVQVMRLMDYYGEPVYSDQEMNALLQVYGAEIPTYLTNIQKEAYMYLRARGIIADTTIRYTEALTLKQMLDILMRVKDYDSRLNLKEIQVTVDIGDTMVSAGLFPRTAVVAANEDAVVIQEEAYTDTIRTFDYYIQIPDDSSKINSMYVPTSLIDGVLEGASMNDAKYEGDETIDGVTYYHMRITATAPTSAYFNNTKTVLGTDENYFVVNYAENKQIAVLSGGGYYTLTGSESNGIAMTNRKIFTDTSEGFCEEMVASASAKANSKSKSLLAMLGNIFKPIVAKADDNDELVRLKIYNVSTTNLLNEEGDLNRGVFTQVKQFGVYDESKDSLVVVLPKDQVKKFKASIERNWEREVLNPAVTIITDVTGANCYVDYQDMVNKGVIYDTLSILGGNGEGDDNILTLETKYGRVLLNNNENVRCVVVGSVMYRVPASEKGLFYTTRDGSGNHLYIDFRAIYGWSNNMIYTEITGDGGSYQVNISTISEAVADEDSTVDDENVSIYNQTIYETKVFMPEAFNDNDSILKKVLRLDKNVVNDYMCVLMVSNYALSNWMVYEGSQSDSLYVFYIDEQFDSLSINKPDAKDKEMMKSEAAPFNIPDNWLVRRIPLSKVSSNIPGTMTYVEDYGYCYVVPNKEDFSLEAYLKGDLYLPLYYDSEHSEDYQITAPVPSNFQDLMPNDTSVGNLSLTLGKLYNANVNYFYGFDYGSRPVWKEEPTNSTDEHAPRSIYKLYYVNYEGKVERSQNTNVTTLGVKAVPAGVQAMFGGVDLDSKEWRSTLNSTLGSDFENSSRTAMYFGTTRLSLKKNEDDTNYLTYIEFENYTANDGNTYVFRNSNTSSDMAINRLQLEGDSKFYRVAAWLADFRRLDKYYSIYELTNENLTSIGSEGLSENELVDTIEIANAINANRYKGFEEFSLKYMLNKLDEGSSWVFVFCLKILPLVAISALTIIIGCAFLADNKIMHKIVSKTFDPVKLLTFGRMDFQTLSRRKALITLMVGYLAFVLVMDGNIIRVIIFLSELWSSFSELLRNV